MHFYYEKILALRIVSILRNWVMVKLCRNGNTFQFHFAANIYIKTRLSEVWLIWKKSYKIHTVFKTFILVKELIKLVDDLRVIIRWKLDQRFPLQARSKLPGAPFDSLHLLHFVVFAEIVSSTWSKGASVSLSRTCLWR